MSCGTGKSCHSKWCAWLQSLAQVAVAGVVLYAGYVVNGHMESWTRSFEQGSDDLHTIRINMENIAVSMNSIDNDMEDIKERMEVMANIGHDMEIHTHEMSASMDQMNHQLSYMNHNVGGIRNKFSPQGMMRGFMPF